MTRVIKTASAAMASLAFGGAALAAEEFRGKATPGGHHFREPASEVMSDIIWLDDFLHVIMILIVLLVTGLMIYAIYKFSAKRNPTPQTFTHNSTLEVIWTAVPVVILIVLAIPSLKLLFLQLEVPKPDLTIKATGHQWFWSYSYPKEKIEFEARMIGDKEGTIRADVNDEIRAELKKAGYKEDEYRLATDNKVVVPVNKVVHVLVTATDVIHAWTIPSFGSKIDAMPGRINETWFKATRIGTYFGQCSELCGKDHAYMPIVVKVVSQADYEIWVNEQVSRKRGKTKVAAAKK